MSAEQSERSEDDSETDENAAQGDEHKDEMVESVVKAGESKLVREPCIPDCSEEAQAETVKNEDAQAVARSQSISEPKETEAKVTNKCNSEIKMMEAGKLDSETSDATSAVLPPSLKNSDSQQRSKETEVKIGWPSTIKEADGDKTNSGVPQKDRVQKPLRSSEATHTVTEHFGSAQGRVVSNAVPAMNSQSHDRMGSMTSDFMDLSVQDGVTHEPPQLQFQRRTSQPQSSIYHRSLPVKKTNAPSWYVPPNRPIINPNALPLSDFPDSSVPSAYIDPPFTHPANAASARKRSISTPYIGSHVIAAETGPSLTISLRRPTSERPWGFTFYGGAEYGCPPFVNKVSKNSLASRYGIEVGDVIVSICRLLTVGKTQEQLKAEILRAGNELDLVLIRRGIDLDKVSQCVPQVLTSSVRSPTQSTSPVNSNVSSPEAFPSYQSPIRGHSFRNVKTKSLRILEEQLAAGQPSSVLRTKQHFQGARGLPASGANTTFTAAYGQTSDQGYRGRIVNVQPTNTLGFLPNSTSVNIAPPLSPTNYAAYQPSQVLTRFGTSYDRPVYPSVANWDTQSDQSSYRTYQRSNSAGSGMQTSGMVHISPSQRDPQMATTAITVPIQRSQPRTDWPGSSYLRPNLM